VLRRSKRGEHFLAGFAFLFFASATFALDPGRTISQYVHEKWGTDRGFVGGAVLSIGQSTDGYLWIGTERGLVRFDGSNFTLIQRPIPGSPIGPVRGLISDKDGNLWIRLEGPNMLIYRNGIFEDALVRFDLQEITFSATALDNDGNILLAGLGDRTLRSKNGKLETVLGADSNPGTVMSMAETRDHRVWFGTRDDGLSYTADGRVTKVSADLEDTKINALLAAYNGGLWIGTDHGLQFWSGNGLTRPNLPSFVSRAQILAIVKDRNANTWIGTNNGIVRISGSGKIAPEGSAFESGSKISAIYEDRDGDLWFGGPQGIERLQNGMFKSYSLSQGLPSTSNGPIYVDSMGRTWFAPLSGGLYWIEDGSVGRVTADGLKDDVVYSISGCGDEVWVGRQNGGLTRINSKTEPFTTRTYTHADGLAQNTVYSVNCSRDGIVWAGTVSAGVSAFAGGKFTNYSGGDGLPANSINSIVESSDGTMWFATPNGLASFDKGVWTSRSSTDGLPSSNVRTIFEDKEHVLWIVTSGGLAYLSGHIVVPQKQPEVLREQILGISEDRMGWLWFVTSDHVLRVNRNQLLNGSLDAMGLQTFGIRDGLLGVEGVSRDRSILADETGRIWVSLDRGISVAEPAIPGLDIAPLGVRIDSSSADGDLVNLRNTSKLPARVRSIVFNYSGTSLAAAERVRFRYKLDGFDRDWSAVVTSRQVGYSNLGPGQYYFHIVASSVDGLWNGPETTIPFQIEPALWQTWWFQTSCLIAGLLMAWSLHRLRIYQLTHRLNTRFQDRLDERTRIAQELHDTLLQGILSASLQLDVAEDQIPAGSPAKALIRRVLELMQNVAEEGRRALKGLRAPAASDSSLEVAFSHVRQELGIDGRVNYHVIVDSTARPVRPMVRDDIYRIGREALVNAFVHAKARGIEVEIEYATKYLRLSIRDDGCGIDPEVLRAGREGHWGLKGMQERSKRIGASLKLRSRIGAGTEVELTVPSAIAFEEISPLSTSRFLSWFGRKGPSHSTKTSGTWKNEH
jgi:signal transduction histidine kinase